MSIGPEQRCPYEDPTIRRISMVAVSNATPLIYLAKITHLELLRKTYQIVYVCTDVWREAIYPLLFARPIPEDIPVILQARRTVG